MGLRSETREKIRSWWQEGLPLNLSAVGRRAPEVIDEVYRCHPFIGWRGALEAEGICYSAMGIELLDWVDCKLCGKKCGILTGHLRAAHEIESKEYRQEFPGAELMAESIRAARMVGAVSPAPPHWEPVWSVEYVVDRVHWYAVNGWDLSYSGMCVVDRPLAAKTLEYWGSEGWGTVLEIVGYDPVRYRKKGVCCYLSEEDVIRGLQERVSRGEELTDSVLLREDLRLYNAARRRFGSMARACEAAGVERVLLRLARFTLEHEVAFQRDVQGVIGGNIGVKEVKERWNSYVYGRGGWEKCLNQFGINRKAAVQHGLLMTQIRSVDDVLDHLRVVDKLDRRAGPLFQKHRTLYNAAARYFGSVKKALEAVAE